MLKRVTLSLLLMITLSSCGFTKGLIPTETVTPLAPEPPASPAAMSGESIAKLDICKIECQEVQ